MKKTLVFAAIVALAAQAPTHARDYQDAVFKQQLCDRMADYGAMTRKGALEGKPTSVSKNPEIGHMVIIVGEIERVIGSNPQLYTEQEAKMEAWAICMDRFKRVQSAILSSR